MTASTRARWQWRERAVALEPQAALAWGAFAARLHARLEKMPAELQARILATANRDVLVITGSTVDLPWVDGVEYASQSPEAPLLWLPTRWQPGAPCDLLARALGRQYDRRPLLLWPKPFVVVPLDRLLPVSPALLARISAQWQLA